MQKIFSNKTVVNKVYHDTIEGGTFNWGVYLDKADKEDLYALFRKIIFLTF